MHNRRLKTLTVVATMLGAVSGAWAHETGMTGRSGKQVLNCGECHTVCSVKGPCTFPVTTFTGPTTMTAGETQAFTFVVTGGPGAFLNKGAGFNVAASSGTLASTDATIKTVGGELTHTAPHLFAGLKSVVFTFNYTAPDVAGDITLFGAGNSVDLSGTPAGDKWKTTTHVITVTGVPVTDSGTQLDSGTELDSGTNVDSGTNEVDSGTLDAGSTTAHDAGTSADAGTGNAAAKGCSTTGGGSALVALGVAMAAFFSRRMRRAS